MVIRMEYSVEKRNRYLEVMIDYQKECAEKGIPCTLIGDRVKFFREELGLNKSAFAKHAGINRTTLYKIEDNSIIPSLKLLCKIVDALNVIDYDFALTEEQLSNDYKGILTKYNEPYNIYKLQEEICNELDTKFFCYYANKKLKVFPQKYLELLKKNVMASFSVLALIPHDEDQGKSYNPSDLSYQKDILHVLKKMKEEAEEEISF